jgi:hypothetical protein
MCDKALHESWLVISSLNHSILFATPLSLPLTSHPIRDVALRVSDLLSQQLRRYIRD